MHATCTSYLPTYLLYPLCHLHQLHTYLPTCSTLYATCTSYTPTSTLYATCTSYLSTKITSSTLHFNPSLLAPYSPQP